MYIKFPKKRDVYMLQNEKIVYVYMLIRYCMHNILSNMGKK